MGGAKPASAEGRDPSAASPFGYKSTDRSSRSSRRSAAVRPMPRATGRRGTAERWRGESQRGRSAHVRIGRPDRRNSCAAGQLDRAGSREARMACDPVWHFGCPQPSDGQYFRTGSFVAAPRAESRLVDDSVQFRTAPSCWSPTSTLPNFTSEAAVRLACAACHRAEQPCRWKLSILRELAFLSERDEDARRAGPGQCTRRS